MPLVFLPQDSIAMDRAVRDAHVAYDAVPNVDRQTNTNIDPYSLRFSSDGFLTFASKRELAMIADHAIQTGARIKIRTVLPRDTNGEYFRAWDRELRIVDYLKHLGIPTERIDREIVI